MVDTAPDSPDSPQIETENLVVDEEDVIKKFTVKKAVGNVAIDTTKVG